MQPTLLNKNFYAAPEIFFRFPLFLLILSIASAQKNTEILGIDNFDEASNALVQANWYTYTDDSNGGRSTGTKSIVKESSSNNQYMQFTYTLDQGKCIWAPYTALSFNVTSAAVPNNLQAISYRFKGNAHILVVKTTNIKDYCYYIIDIPASSVWTTVTIPVSELRQPWWGQQASLDINAFEGLSWQVSGKTDDSGMVSIDDVNILYTPQLAINPKPVIQKPLSDTIHTIHSNILNEDRQIYMYLPPSYDASKPSFKKYPVVYLLDGDYHIEYVGGLIEKLSAVNYNTAFPEMIVVGIANTNRMRDLSPTHITTDPFEANSKRFDASGGGAAFISFIEKELMPMIEKTYPTANYKTFVGHSLGGLTVIHTLIHKPYLFDAYLALDPSLWWDNELLLKQADATFNKINLHNKKLYIAIANTMYKGVDTEQIKNDTSGFSFQLRANLNFVDKLNKYSKTGLTWSYTYYPDENHNSVTNPGQLDGMNYFFELKQSDINKHFITTTTDSRFSISNTLASHDMGYTVCPPEKLINDHAYSYLDKKNYALAFYLFQLNVNNYPLSPFAFDALGDYYVAMNNIKNARKNYSHAILLSEGRMEDTKRKLEKLN